MTTTTDPHTTDADDPTAEPDAAPPADHQRPAPRSLDWWKAQAREHQATADALTTERDALKARVETLQKQHVESLVADKLHDPGDLWRYGTELPIVLDDNGDVDPAKVEEARAALAKDRPQLAPTPPSPAAPASLVTANDPITHGDDDPKTFGDVLRDGARRRTR